MMEGKHPKFLEDSKPMGFSEVKQLNTVKFNLESSEENQIQGQTPGSFYPPHSIDLDLYLLSEQHPTSMLTKTIVL